MSNSTVSTSLEALKEFQFERILNEDAFSHALIVLGSFPALPARLEAGRVKAIIRIEKTALDPANAASFFGANGLVKRVQAEGSTDIYSWFFGWLGDDRERDVKISVICPATEVHIRKYSKQEQIMIQETPELYEKVVRPFIMAIPTSRTQWVENILLGLSEQEKVLFSSPDFVILPDMKWDLKTLSSLYLIAIAQDRTIRSLRDLRKAHLPLLKAIHREATRVVAEKWGLGKGSLRMHVHYQPSYYHFHVHIVNVNYSGAILGMSVGQAHLLDDVISLLELDPTDGPGIFERMTLTYGLGDQHGLLQAIRATEELVHD